MFIYTLNINSLIKNIIHTQNKCDSFMKVSYVVYDSELSVNSRKRFMNVNTPHKFT